MHQTDASRHIRNVVEVATADKSNVMRLIEITGMNPATDFRFENWSGVSFSGIDLGRFDFTGARLDGCDFSGSSLISSGSMTAAPPGSTTFARFDQAELGRVIHRPDRDPQLPVEMTVLANPSVAQDWQEYLKVWCRAASRPKDNHLPTGAIFQDAPFAPQMVVVPAGEFELGLPDNSRRTVVIPRRIAVGRFPVLYDEWNAAIARGANAVKPVNVPFGSGRQPALGVGTLPAGAYVKWLIETTGMEYRLLSESELEYCYQAGNKTPIRFKPEHQKSQDDPDTNGILAVDQLTPNAWGIVPMQNKIREWRTSWNSSQGDDLALALDAGTLWPKNDSVTVRPVEREPPSMIGYADAGRGDVYFALRLARTLA